MFGSLDLSIEELFEDRQVVLDRFTGEEIDGMSG